MTEEQATDLINSLFESWYIPLVRYAKRFSVARDKAEDLVQDTFLALYRELREGTNVENPRAWTTTVLRNRIIRQAVQVEREASLLSSLELLATPAAEPPANPQQQPNLNELLATLTVREQEVIFLRLSAMRYKEVAFRLGISINSVKTLLCRALRKLKKSAESPEANEHRLYHANEIAPKTLQ
jgi:RNA polymerase sigma-70 factor (ECF subfamily)